MLDLTFVRRHPDTVREALARRGSKFAFDAFLKLDTDYLSAQQQLDADRREKNENAKSIGDRKKAGEDIAPYLEVGREIAIRVKTGDETVQRLGEAHKALVLMLPNLPHASVPDGLDETLNIEVRRWSPEQGFDVANRVLQALEGILSAEADDQKWLETWRDDANIMALFSDLHEFLMRSLAVSKRIFLEDLRLFGWQDFMRDNFDLSEFSVNWTDAEIHTIASRPWH